MGRMDDIRRLRERMASGKLSQEEAASERMKIKSRVVGILLQDARTAAGRTAAEAAELLGLTESAYAAFEAGEQAPTLPQLEILAYFYNVPLRHFWSGQTLASQRGEVALHEEAPEILALRQRIIGLSLQQLREDAEMSLDEAAEQSGLAADHIAAAERGEIALPIGEMEALAAALKASMEDFSDGHGRVGKWLQSQTDFERFSALPAETRAFVLQPINRTYLDLARKLSEMEVGRLRMIAESILEITL